MSDWKWLENQKDERWGELRRYVNPLIYRVDQGWDPEAEDRTKPWLVWKSNDNLPGGDDAPDEVRFVRWIEDQDHFQSWKAFREHDKVVETFTLARYYGRQDGRSEMKETVLDLCDRLGLTVPDPDPISVLGDLKIIREECRTHLGNAAENLRTRVMEPLRAVLIPCAIEAARSLTEFRPATELSDEAQRNLFDAVRDLDHLWKIGIGSGIPWEIVHEHENWYGRTFQHVPDPVAEGAKVALRRYVERNEDKHRDMSRDGILDRTRPVFLKWMAARRMIWSALYEWTLSEAADQMENAGPTERGQEYLEAVFKLKEQQYDSLAAWSEAVVNRCPKSNGQIPDWRAFRSWLVDNGLHEPYGEFKTTRERAQKWANDLYGDSEGKE